MERISGWYKRRLQTISLIVALGLTVLLNMGSISISKALWESPALRARIAVEAVVDVEMCKNSHNCSYLEQQAGGNRAVLKKLPVGGIETVNLLQMKPIEVVYKIPGWLFTAFAASLGAPFWFDLLGKLNSIRSSGGKQGSTV